MTVNQDAALDPRLLTLAICHEVGNHLAAIRLSAHILTTEGSEPGMGDELNKMAAEAGMILAQVRFLQNTPVPDPPPISVARVMQELRFTLGDKLDGPVEVQFHQAVDGDLLFEKEVLVRQLSNLMTEALAASDAGQAVSLSITPATNKHGVEFVISDSTKVEHHEQLPGAEPRRGRLLGLQVAHTLIAARGGTFSTDYNEPGLVAKLYVPLES